MDLSHYQQILVFGGTFDPPHAGHVALPFMAAEAIGADAIAWVPARVSPFKQNVSSSGPGHRLAMLRLAVADDPRALVLTDEIERDDGEPSYTVDTLRRLRDRAGAGTRLRLLIGADQLRKFDRWKEPAAVIELGDPLVILRPPDTPETLLSALDDEADRREWAGRIVRLPRLDISSTDIRRRMATGRSVRGLLPPAVEDYARCHGLYTAGEPDPDEHLIHL